MVKTSLYIVDVHNVVIQGLSSFLIGNEEFEIIGNASSANELFDFLQIKQPDILVLDIKLPGLQGFNIAQIIANKYPEIKILFLSSNIDEESLNKAISSGGLGYLTKDVQEEEFIFALNKIKKGENYYCSSMQNTVFKEFTEKFKSTQNNTPLSSREIEVIRLFVDGYSYKEIANNLSISTRTVESHKKHILEKLELKTTVDLVKYAIRNGIISL